LPLLAAGGCTRPRNELPVYLTWSDPDTSTTMTVHYHTLGPFEGTHVYYDTQPRHGELAKYAAHARGFERRIEGVDRVVHVAPLTHLRPDTVYWFVAGDATSGFRRERSFRTLPADDSPIDFVAGGDMSIGWQPRFSSWRAARTQPRFALLGGDLAYCDGMPEGYERWQRWFDDWDVSMRTSEGHLIPIVAAVGNHDRRRSNDAPPGVDPAPFFNGFFYQDPAGRSYFSRRFGARAALSVLDTGHLTPHGGAQRDWLAAELREHAEIPVRFALYHVALFPAARPLVVESDPGHAWLPLFDEFRLTAAFENHGHLHKRTVPLRGGRPVTDGGGTVYFGDGCWGKARPRPPRPGLGYLATASQRQHFWRVSVSKQGAEYKAIDAFGRVFDRAAQSADGAWTPA
jgi:hypothetical protein